MGRGLILGLFVAPETGVRRWDAILRGFLS